MGKNNATIYDVARLSGVSVATVSRVLGNAAYPVSPATRMKVLHATQQLHYTVNITGKTLKTERTREIGIIVPNISNPSYAQLVQGIQAVAMENDYDILLYNSNRDGDMERRNFKKLLEKRVDGILLVSIRAETDMLSRARELDCRLISVEQDPGLQQLHVGYDYTRAGELATEYLIGCGHRRIGFIGAPLDRTSRYQMLEGYRRALMQAGLEERAETVWLKGVETERNGLFEVENGRAAAQFFCEQKIGLTACVCLNDLTALGAMQKFADYGCRVPQDISIIGFDNIAYGELSTPRLTTIDQHAERMGREAMRLMVHQINSPDEEWKKIMLEPNLVIRESVAPFMWEDA